MFTALKDYLISKLSSANLVTLGYVDERADTSSELSLPMITIHIYDSSIDFARRTGGMRIVLDNGDGTSNIQKPPIPINYHFQVDTLTDKFLDHWTITEALTVIIGRQWSSFTTASGDTLHIIPVSIDPLPGLEDNLHRTAFRFYVEAWLTDSTIPTVVNQVTTLQIVNNSQEVPGGTVEVT
jgi:hypothetical protein